MIKLMEPKKMGVKMLKNTFFSVFLEKGAIYWCIVTDFNNYEKQNLVEKCLVTEHWGWILSGTTIVLQS